jgi:hypothetical protein
MLDSVNEKLPSSSGARPQDQAKVEQYTEAVRDVERRIQKAEEQAASSFPRSIRPQGVPASFEDHLALMLDLQLLAFQSDLTRVIIVHDRQGAERPPVSADRRAEAHHPLSHHNERTGDHRAQSKINRYHTELLSKYLARLSATRTATAHCSTT